MVFARVASRSAAASLRASRAAPLSNAFRASGGVRALSASATQQGKVLMVLYDVSISIEAL